MLIGLTDVVKVLPGADVFLGSGTCEYDFMEAIV